MLETNPISCLIVAVRPSLTGIPIYELPLLRTVSHYCVRVSSCMWRLHWVRVVCITTASWRSPFSHKRSTRLPAFGKHNLARKIPVDRQKRLSHSPSGAFPSLHKLITDILKQSDLATQRWTNNHGTFITSTFLSRKIPSRPPEADEHQFPAPYPCLLISPSPRASEPTPPTNPGNGSPWLTKSKTR